MQGECLSEIIFCQDLFYSVFRRRFVQIQKSGNEYTTVKSGYSKALMFIRILGARRKQETSKVTNEIKIIVKKISSPSLKTKAIEDSKENFTNSKARPAISPPSYSTMSILSVFVLLSTPSKENVITGRHSYLFQFGNLLSYLISEAVVAQSS